MALGSTSALVLALPVAAGIAAPTGAGAHPTAVEFDGLPTVGALFAGPTGTSMHFCTASVVHSRHRDVIVSAAHCVRGTGAGLSFAPGFHDGEAPYGVWSVSGVYVDPPWTARQDPDSDYAFLTLVPKRLAARRLGNIEDVTGANRLRTDRGFTNSVTVTGYPTGIGGRPIVCAGVTYRYAGDPGFDCEGYVGGTSGSPWLVDVDPATSTAGVNGVIGGLHQGGCTSATSYTAYFGSRTVSVLDRADDGDGTDVLPVPAGDGC